MPEPEQNRSSPRGAGTVLRRAAGPLALVFLSAFLLWRAVRTWDGLNDDQYITLTYAKNLAAGQGFVYNAGPPVLGTTSPLFTLCTAALTRLFAGSDAAHVGVVFSAVCLAATGWLLYLGRRTLGLGPLAAVLIAALWLNNRSAYLGGEYPLLQLLVLAAALCSARPLCRAVGGEEARGLAETPPGTAAGRYVGAGILAGLAFLARGEGALLLPALMIFLPAGKRLRGVVALSAGFALPVLAWSLYAWPTFGAILPHTLAVKLAQGHAAPWAERFPVGLWRDMVDTWGRHLWASAPALRWAVWPVALAGGALLLRATAWRVLGLWILLHALAYSVMGLPAYCYWYRFPEYWLWLAGLGVGAAAWLHWWPAPKALRLVSRAVAGVVIALIIAGPILVETALARARVEDPRARPYREIADWLRAHAQPGDTVAATEVGYLGYYTAQPILDLAGITSPEVLPLVRPGDANLAVVDRFQPLYWVDYWGVAQQDAPVALRTAHCAYERVLAPRGANGRGESTVYPLYRRTHATAPGGTTSP